MTTTKGLMMTIFKPFEHQLKFGEMWNDKRRVLNFDGCGTGKTLSCIHAVRTYWPDARVLVLAPLSILEPAWGKDLAFGWPLAEVEIVTGSTIQKRRAFDRPAQWYITNHDTVKLIDELDIASRFDVMIIDEGDVFRNRETMRSKAALKVSSRIPVITLMTGTPTPNSVTDVWHLAFMIDKGERLGRLFSGFRNQVCTPTPIMGAPPGAMRWADKDCANDYVSMCLADICSRVALNDVQELPETIVRDIEVLMPAKLRKAYEAFKRESLMMVESGEIVDAIHAGARFQKLLQLVSGSIYDAQGVPHDIHKQRHELVLDLVEETDHALVAFNWTHQRDGLAKEAKKRGITFDFIDGSVPSKKRTFLVDQFQKGKLRVLFCQPQSAGHGLTLTKANRVIWASPTFRADLYEQFNHRIIRTGQKRKTEIIHVAAAHSVEEQVYEKLQGKQGRMMDLLATFQQLFNAA